MQNNVNNREFEKFEQDAAGQTTVRTVAGQNALTLLPLVVGQMSMSFRYAVITPGVDEQIVSYYDAYDRFASGYKVTANKVEIYFPNLLQEQGEFI